MENKYQYADMFRISPDFNLILHMLCVLEESMPYLAPPILDSFWTSITVRCINPLAPEFPFKF